MALTGSGGSVGFSVLGEWEGIRTAREAMGKKAYLTSNVTAAEELSGMQTILAAHHADFEALWDPLSSAVTLQFRQCRPL